MFSIMLFYIFPISIISVNYFYKEKKGFLTSNSGYFCKSNSNTKTKNQKVQNSLIIILIQAQATTWRKPPTEVYHTVREPPALTFSKPNSSDWWERNLTKGISCFGSQREQKVACFPPTIQTCSAGDSRVSPKSVVMCQEQRVPVKVNV